MNETIKAQLKRDFINEFCMGGSILDRINGDEIDYICEWWTNSSRGSFLEEVITFLEEKEKNTTEDYELALLNKIVLYFEHEKSLIKNTI